MPARRLTLALILGLAALPAAAQERGGRNGIDGPRGGAVTIVPSTASGDVSTGSSGTLHANGSTGAARAQGEDSKAGTTGMTQVR